MPFRKTIAVYYEKTTTTYTNAICGQNADIFNVKAVMPLI
jgi:hypothetical protein